MLFPFPLLFSRHQSALSEPLSEVVIRHVVPNSIYSCQGFGDNSLKLDIPAGIMSD